MAATTLLSAEYDLAFYMNIGEVNEKEYVLTYTVPDVPDTIESELFEERIPQFNSSAQGGIVGANWTYPATDLPTSIESPPSFNRIKEARLIETIRTPIE